MNFFKSVFSDDQTPSDSPTSLPPPPPGPNLAESPAWSFGGLIKSLAAKSESMIDTYRRDLEELGSGLRKETAVIREAASRAFEDLPASLEAGASVAQESLETVGKAVDDIGSTVWKSTAQIVSVGRDSILAPDYESNAWNNDYGSDNQSVRKQRSLDVQRYSRFDVQLRALQCNWDTYCTEPEDRVEYERWRIRCFVLEEKRGEIEALMDENAVVREIYNEVVPGKIDGEGFWSRYFYKVHKLKQAEEARAMLVKRAIAGEEEEDLSWDFDDDGDDLDHDCKEGEKGESCGNVELEKKSSHNSNDGMKSASKNLVQEEKIANLSNANSESYNKLEERCEENALVVVEGEGDNAESCKDSDVSVVSSQSPLLEEEDLGWDEIDNIGSNYENKGEAVGNIRSANRFDLCRRLSAAEEEEDLSWDVEDEDDEPVKP